MSVHGTQGWARKKRKHWKSSSARPTGVENYLARDYIALEPESKWVTDISEVKTLGGKLFLCVVIDLFSKRVVGWAMHHRQNRHMVIRAVEMSIWQREETTPVILHSDRGCQFTSGDYQQ